MMSFLKKMSIYKVSRKTAEIILRFHRILLFCKITFVVLFS